MLYMLNIKCSGGCLRDVIGRVRPSHEEFTPEERKEFFDAVRANGWVEKNDAWFCGAECPGDPFTVEKLREAYPTISRRLHGKLKLVNPDFFAAVTIANL